MSPARTLTPRLATFIALAALLATPGAALARGGDERALQRLAAPEVRALVSRDLDGALYRVLLIDAGARPALVLEVLRPDGSAGGARTQRSITQVQHGLDVLALADIARGIDGLALHGERVTFDVAVGSHDILACRFDLRAATLPLCDGHLPITPPAEHGAAPHRPRPNPLRPAWGARPEVIAACSQAFYGEANELACLERVRVFDFDPLPTIAACDTHAYGDEAALQCLTAAATFAVAPAATIAACDAATYGQQSFLDCLGQAVAFGYDPVATIQACDRAMYGDQSTLTCVGLASRYPFDATTAIQSCDQAMVGDDAALTCIRRGGAF